MICPLTIIIPHLRSHKSLKAISMQVIYKHIMSIFFGNEKGHKDSAYEVKANISVKNYLSCDWMRSFKFITKKSTQKFPYLNALENSLIYENIMTESKIAKELEMNIQNIRNSYEQIDFSNQINQCLKNLNNIGIYLPLKNMINANEQLFREVALKYKKLYEKRNYSKTQDKNFLREIKIKKKFQNPILIIHSEISKLKHLEKIENEITCNEFPHKNN